MKFRSGFVSNSSSQSFIVVGKKPPVKTPASLLNQETARRVIQRAIDNELEFNPAQATIDALRQLDPKIQDIWLTHFISDASDYTDPLDEAEYEYYPYHCGAHVGPYDPESFTMISGDDASDYEAVWVRNEDIVDEQHPLGQLDIDFAKKREENEEEDEDDWDDEYTTNWIDDEDDVAS